jgi:hypothetical protein
MKKITILALILTSMLLLCSCTVDLTSAEEYDLLVSNELPISIVYPFCVFDINVIENVIGYSDYVFVGKVVGYKQTTIDASGMPNTTYFVEVIENIKGSLTAEEEIELIKSGGLDENYKSIVLYESDIMPKINEYYVFSVYGLQSGGIKAEGLNTTIKIENTENYKIDEEYLRFVEAYENEVVYERTRYKSKYEQE